MIVQTVSNNYSTRRNISYHSKLRNYKRIHGLNNVVNFLPKVINRKISRKFASSLVWTLDNIFFSVPMKSSSSPLHFFNTCNLGRTDWAVTFESVVPRTIDVVAGIRSGPYDETFNHILDDKLTVKLVDNMAHDSCLGLVALSKNAYDMQCQLLDFFGEKGNAIKKKTKVLHPPQDVFFDSYKQTLDSAPRPRVMFVGNDFFRKGGFEILKACERLRKDIDFELVIISRLTFPDYLGAHGPSEFLATQSIIERGKEWIKLHSNLPNEQVLELMASSTVGLLPTWADTYGYSVLEFQSYGCPCITTDIRALPEINNSFTGWVVNVPKSRHDNIDIDNFGKTELSNIIEEGVYLALREALDDSNEYRDRRRNSINRIKEKHGHSQHEKALMSMYRGEWIS